MLSDFEKFEIQRLDAQTCMEYMHECAERLGLMDIPEATKVLGVEKRTIYDRMEKKKLLYFTIGKHKFPCVND